ncbi:hypothetical protein T265_16227, partial [Opisthorchis viverrini]
CQIGLSSRRTEETLDCPDLLLATKNSLLSKVEQTKLVLTKFQLDDTMVLKTQLSSEPSDLDFSVLVPVFFQSVAFEQLL